MSKKKKDPKYFSTKEFVVGGVCSCVSEKKIRKPIIDALKAKRIKVEQRDKDKKVVTDKDGKVASDEMTIFDYLCKIGSIVTEEEFKELKKSESEKAKEVNKDEPNPTT